MNTNYDVMILGTGEAGIYAAYELALKCPSARVLVVDKGADIYRRQCFRSQKPAYNQTVNNSLQGHEKHCDNTGHGIPHEQWADSSDCKLQFRP